MVLTHPEKELFPEIHLTKEDLLEYYQGVQKFMLPYVVGRPLSLLRCPSGRGACFFQKRLVAKGQPQIPAIQIKEKSGKKSPYPYISEAQHLEELVQLNVLEIHCWGAHIHNVERPDIVTFDLDPADDVSPKDTIQAAILVRNLLAEFKLKSFPRVTGGKGIHVVAPINPEYSWKAAKDFCHTVAETLQEEDPSRFIATMTKAKRAGKIFVDYLRNERGSTAIANFSTRAREGAPVAVPISWEDLANAKKIPAFNTKTVFKYIRGTKSPWNDFEKLKQKLPIK